jgi:hypothetical protein
MVVIVITGRLSLSLSLYMVGRWMNCRVQRNRQILNGAVCFCFQTCGIVVRFTVSLRKAGIQIQEVLRGRETVHDKILLLRYDAVVTHDTITFFLLRSFDNTDVYFHQRASIHWTIYF